MLATKGDHVPTGAEWAHEVKWDGVRILLDVTGGAARAHSRNGNVVTPAWPELTQLPDGLPDLLLDGEMIALNERGTPDFRVLQHRMHVRNQAEVAKLVGRIPATFMVFDVLRIGGRDLTGLPLTERRELLEGLDLGRLAVAGPGGVRRRPDAPPGDARPGAGGHRQQATYVALRDGPS
jgi:bifunctional non-homologous end joining protein LigD